MRNRLPDLLRLEEWWRQSRYFDHQAFHAKDWYSLWAVTNYSCDSQLERNLLYDVWVDVRGTLLYQHGAIRSPSQYYEVPGHA